MPPQKTFELPWGRTAYRLSGPELTRAPSSLVDWDTLKDEGHGYRVMIELVRRWVVKEHPLRRAIQELEFINERATLAYENARAAHQANELQTATKLYREALSANPNHFSAQLGLAQALYEREEFSESVIEYERAYRFDPVRSRDDLVKARLNYARDLLLQKSYRQAQQEVLKALEISSEDKIAQERLAVVDKERSSYKRLLYRKFATLAAAVVLVLGGFYAFLLNSYYLSTKTNPFTSPSIVVKLGPPGFDFLPGLGEIRVETDFTTDELSEDQKGEYLEKLARRTLGVLVSEA